MLFDRHVGSVEARRPGFDADRLCGRANGEENWRREKALHGGEGQIAAMGNRFQVNGRIVRQRRGLLSPRAVVLPRERQQPAGHIVQQLDPQNGLAGLDLLDCLMGTRPKHDFHPR